MRATGVRVETTARRRPCLDGGPRARCDAYLPMGATAERVGARGVSRAAQVAWALLSRQQAVAPQDCGHFDAEIVTGAIPTVPW